MKVRIKSMELRTCGRREGSAMVATFCAELVGMQLYNCAILRKEDGHLVAVPTRGKEGPKDVRFADSDLFREFREKAVAMYRLMSGEEPAVVVELVAEEPADEPEDAGMRRFLSAEQEACEIAGL